MNDYLRGELNYKSTLKYYTLGEGVTEWNSGQGALDESEALRFRDAPESVHKAVRRYGYYDLACPMGTVEQVLNN